MDKWLHDYLMRASGWYNHCFWVGNTSEMARMRQELLEILEGPHG